MNGVQERTVAAVSTGMTPSGISIVRMSGKDAIEIADRVFKGKTRLRDAKTHTIHYGKIVENNECVDEVLVSVMRAPNTYTGEDVVEINCHGGLLVTRSVLSAVLKSGAALAEPGEFTKRAFLNGKMDLSRAESVMDLIDAKNRFAEKAGLYGLQGKIRDKVQAIRDELLDEIALIEASLDDPEHYDLDGFSKKLEGKVCEVKASLQELIRKSLCGSVLKEGIRTAILGRPNAGKSSLLNVLSGFEKSIVTDIPGTTRDVLEETVSIGDLTLILEDTAGIRKTDDAVERIGVDRAKKAGENADLILYLVDASEGVTEEDREILKGFQSVSTIFLFNKVDKIAKSELAPVAGMDTCFISCRTEEGIDELVDLIREKFLTGAFSANDEAIVANERQRELLRSADGSLSLVLSGIREGLSEEFLSADLTDAYGTLGKIIGEEIEDDVVDRVFAKFCMGK